MLDGIGLARDADRQEDDEVRRVAVRELKCAFARGNYFHAELLSQLTPNGVKV